MKVCIETKSLAKPITGIERYLFENLARLDELLHEASIQLELVHPEGLSLTLPALKHAALRPLASRGPLDYRLALLRHLKQSNALYVNMSGGLALNHGITVFHDLRPALFDAYDSRSSRLRFRSALSYALRNATCIVTVSSFTKRALVEHYGFDRNRVVVIPNAWQHMEHIEPDEGVFERNPQIKRRSYYYTLGSTAPHKNLAWIQEVARRNPQETFVVAGKAWEGREPAQGDNVHYLGYVSDEESKALMRECKAFLHPSLYEGFGVPPLEAASCGAPVVVSCAASLPEVFGPSVAYVDPYDYDVNLEELVASHYGKKVACGEERPCYKELLARYSWDESARLWANVITACAKGAEGANAMESQSSLADVTYANETLDLGHAKLMELPPADFAGAKVSRAVVVPFWFVTKSARRIGRMIKR